jgi:hypothetical protein
MMAFAATGDQSDASLGFLRYADDSLAHLGVGLAQCGQFFFYRLHALDFVADVL